MPTTVSRAGRTFTEYTPQELDSIRLEQEIQWRERNGRFRTSVSNLQEAQTTNWSHKKYTRQGK